MNYVISKAASYDLEEIWLFTAKRWSREQADRYYNLLLDEIADLCKNPKNGQDYSHIRSGYQRRKVQSHFIFYKINAEKKLLEVIRILHQQMDIDKRLVP